MKNYTLLLLVLLFISCSEAYEKPGYIVYETTTDSIYVTVKNPVISDSFLKIEDLETSETKFLNFHQSIDSIIYKFSKTDIDTNGINKKYRFKLHYGSYNLKEYDTLYNYGLPFLKGKRYRILQGNNGSFSHQKPTSKYAIDFTMNIGQTICAIRDGLVVRIKEDSNEGGRSKDYYDKANIILVAHKDGTFVQYAHLKKDGVVVQKGDTIKKGQIIGYSGNTGYSTQPHLHFAVYKPTKNGLITIPFILDSIPSKKYVKGKFAYNN